MLQKLKFIAVTLFAVTGLVVPLVAAPAVLAASAKPGTCVLQTNQGKQIDEVKSCKSFMPKGKDSTGKAFSASKCYGLSEQNASITIVQEIACSNSIFSGAKPASCPDGTTPADNDTSNCVPTVGGKCVNVSQCDLITSYIDPFINFLAAFVGLAVVISIVIGGIQYGSSAGDSAKVTAAKNRIRNSIIALVTFLFLYALLNFLIPGGLM